MNSQNSKYTIPKNLEHYLSSLSKLYEKDGKRELQRILVNSRITIHEESSFDNWNGGTYGHDLTLTLPDQLYLEIINSKKEIAETISKDLNNIHNCQNEFINAVFLDMETSRNTDWRAESGLQFVKTKSVNTNSQDRIWEKGKYRLFLSHKVEYKKQTYDLKETLQPFGISCFVAHVDIKISLEWQNEIENALHSMDGFAALLTENFRDSVWTDQEIGFALGRNVPIVPLNLGINPYGFIGKYQAAKCTWENADEIILQVLMRQHKMVDVYIDAIENCASFNQGIDLSFALQFIENLENYQIERLCNAYNNNFEAHNSFGLNGTKPTLYGGGVPELIRRISSRKFNIEKYTNKIIWDN